MKKLFLTALLLAAITLPVAAQAQVVAPPVVVPPPPVTAYVGGATLWPFLSFVALGAWVTYADANGIAFPLCGRLGLKCYDDYGELPSNR